MSKTITKAMEYHNKIVEGIEGLSINVEDHVQILQALSMIAIAEQLKNTNEELQNINRQLDSIATVIFNK